MKLDTVTLEVIRNALPAVANEMAADLQRTSYNMMIYEVRDYCTALLGLQGELISQNVGGVSHFVADLGVLVTDGLNRYGRDGFKPGDVIITNHQAVAGQHLNNVVIYMPYFYKGELLMFLMVRAHWIDVGGTSTGFGAGATVADPWLEGLQLDQLKIYEEGKLNDTLYRVIKDNIRFPESSLGDMKSQMAACRLAARRLDELFDKYGRETLLAAIDHIFDEKWDYLAEQRDSRQDEVIAEIATRAEVIAPDEMLAAIKEWWEPLLRRARTIRTGVGGNVRFRIGELDMVVDFPKAKVREYAGEDCIYWYTIPADLVSTNIRDHEIDWSNSIFLSMQFEVGRSGKFNEFLTTFLKCLSRDRIEYVENWYAEQSDQTEDAEIGGWMLQRRCPHLLDDRAAV